MKNFVLFICFICANTYLVQCQPADFCTISGISTTVTDGKVLLLRPLLNDTLAKGELKNGAFELSLSAEKAYTGMAMLSFARTDKKRKSSAMIFVEPAHIYFAQTGQDELCFAGTENQLKVNNLVKTVNGLSNKYANLQGIAADSLTMHLSQVFDDFMRDSKGTPLQSFALLIAADLLAKGKLSAFHLPEGETICANNTNNDPNAMAFCKYFQDAKVAIIGTKLPELVLKDSKDKPVSLSEYRDPKKYLLIDFWASWCGPCLKKFKDLAPYLADHKRKIQVLTVSIDQTPEQWKNKLAELDLPYTNLYDENKTAYNLLKAKAIPYLLVVDKNNHIIAVNPKNIADVLK